MNERIKNVKLGYGSPWLKYFSITHENGIWDMVSRKDDPLCATGIVKADAVSIAAVHTPTQSMVVTKEFRYPLGDYEYGIPAGLIDDGETAETAARRELKEETGLDMTEIIQCTPPLFSSAGMTDESVPMIFVKCDGNFTSKYTEENEDIETLLLNSEELYKLMRRKDIKFGARGYLAFVIMMSLALI